MLLPTLAPGAVSATTGFAMSCQPSVTVRATVSLVVHVAPVHEPLHDGPNPVAPPEALSAYVAHAASSGSVHSPSTHVTVWLSLTTHVPPDPAGQLMPAGVLVTVPVAGRFTVSLCVIVGCVITGPGSGQSLGSGHVGGTAAARPASDMTAARVTTSKGPRRLIDASVWTQPCRSLARTLAWSRTSPGRFRRQTRDPGGLMRHDRPAPA